MSQSIPKDDSMNTVSLGSRSWISPFNWRHPGVNGRIKRKGQLLENNNWLMSTKKTGDEIWLKACTCWKGCGNGRDGESSRVVKAGGG
jgi:hypothetical protein